MMDWRTLLRELLTDRFDLFVAVLVVLFALFLGIATLRLVRRMLDSLGVPEAIEGTPFERTARRLGTSTVSLLAELSGLFVLGLGVVLAARIVGLLGQGLFASRVSNFIPQIFVAVIVLITGVLVGEKAALLVNERLSGMKVSGVDAIPTVLKYSIFYVAAVVALDQVGVATTALVVLLAIYAVAIVVVGVVATKHMLMSAAVGVYLLLEEPYSIGDEVEIDGQRGIVQEVDVFVTHIEEEGEEYVVPNHQVFAEGVARVVD